MYSDVIFGWVLWILVISWHFVSNILFFFRYRLKIWWGHVQDFFFNLPGVVVGLRPPRIPRQIKKKSPGRAPIKFLSDSEKKIKYQKKVTTITNIHNISQKNVTIYIVLFVYLCQKIPSCINLVIEHIMKKTLPFTVSS